MALPDSIRDRIELFTRNEEQYRDSGYKEAQLRQEFLDPLFAALGWDMDNRAGHAESYKDVIHEDAIKIGSETKAPDGSFPIGGTRKVFINDTEFDGTPPRSRRPMPLLTSVFS